MLLNNKVIIVTGGAHGIGRALCERFVQEQPRGIVVADIDVDQARRVAENFDGMAVECDVSDEESVKQLVRMTESRFGPVDLFCANAGIGFSGGLELSDDDWRNMLNVNFMSHVYAARSVVPSMRERRQGYLLHTASAAGLLTELSSAPYSVTKHAVVALAEWLAITYGNRGLKVSCLCPQGVRTRMIEGDHPIAEMLRQSSISAEEVAEFVVRGIDKEQFLILPHPEVAEYFQRKAGDYDRWLSGMRQLREQVLGGQS
jgi:NAD(P)-dependent dehydrogenase (short-subunit alcohol dehydrogenase family)